MVKPVSGSPESVATLILRVKIGADEQMTLKLVHSKYHTIGIQDGQ